MTSIGKKTSRIVSFFLGVLIVYMLTQPFVGSTLVNDAVHDQSGSRVGSVNKYRYYAFGGSGNTVNAKLAILGNYSYDRVSFLNGGTLQFDMTSQYLSLANNEFMFQVWNTTDSANPQVSIILPIAPTYVLNALDYSYSGGAVTIDGRQSNQTVTMSVGSLSSTKTIKIPSSTATISDVSYSEAPSQLTIQSSQGSSSQVTVTGASQTPLNVSLNGSPSPRWSYATSSDMLTLNGVGTWVVSYTPSTSTTTSTNTTAAPFDFSLSNSGGITVTPGNPGTNAITVTLASGSPQGVSLSCSGLPAGASCSFNPASGNPTYQSVLTISTSPLTSAGSYPISVTGVAGPVSHTTSFMLNVNSPAFDFSLSALPLPSLQPGNSGSTTVQVNLLNGNPQYVSLSCGNQTLGLTCTFDPAVSLPIPTDFQSKLTVSTTSSTPLGSWPITVIGSAGNLSRIVQLSITITALTQITKTLTTGIVSGSGSVSPNCPAGCPFTVGQSVNVTATPSSGWEFYNWTIAGASCSGGFSSNPCTITMPNNTVTVSPTFTQLFAITFYSNPSSFVGASSPGSTNACGGAFTTGQVGACGGSFSATANLPSPSSGWQFDHWSWSGGVSCPSGSTNPVTCSTTGSGSLTAVYAAQVTFITNPNSSALISWGSCGNPAQGNGQSIFSTSYGSVTACYVPSGYTFFSWSCSGGLACSSSSNPTIATFTGPGTITLNLKTGSLSNPISTSISATVSPSPIQGEAQFTVSGNLTANGVGVGGEKVKLVFAWNTTAVTVTTNPNGSYTYSANAPEQNGSYNISVYFSGDMEGTNQYLPSTATAKVSVS